MKAPWSDRNQSFIVQKKRKRIRRATFAVLQCRHVFLLIIAMTVSFGPLFSAHFYTKQNAQYQADSNPLDPQDKPSDFPDADQDGLSDKMEEVVTPSTR